MHFRGTAEPRQYLYCLIVQGNPPERLDNDGIGDNPSVYRTPYKFVQQASTVAAPALRPAISRAEGSRVIIMKYLIIKPEQHRELFVRNMKAAHQLDWQSRGDVLSIAGFTPKSCAVM